MRRILVHRPMTASKHLTPVILCLLLTRRRLSRYLLHVSVVNAREAASAGSYLGPLRIVDTLSFF